MIVLTAAKLAEYWYVRTSADTFDPEGARTVPARLRELERLISTREWFALSARRGEPKGHLLN